MAKRSAVAEKHVEEYPAEEESQEQPEEDAGDLSKTDLIREALEAGHNKPADGVSFIQTKYGRSIDPKYFSIVKTKLSKGDTPERPRSAPQAAESSGNVPKGLGADLKELKSLIDQVGGADELKELIGQMRGLIAKYGAELPEMIDALG